MATGVSNRACGPAAAGVYDQANSHLSVVDARAALRKRGPLFCCLDGARPLRARTPQEQRLLEIADPVAADLALEIVRLRVQGSEPRKLQIMAERADGTMDVDACADLSRALSAVLDVEDPFPGEWSLEVSSPGIDRPLTRAEDFERWAGHEAKIQLDRLVEGRRRFRGVLAGRDADNVALDMEGEDDTALIPLDWIEEARLVMSDALIEESLRRSKSDGANRTEGDSG